MLPNNFSEQVVRLYIKRHEEKLSKKTEVVSRLFECFKNWCLKNQMIEAKVITVFCLQTFNGGLQHNLLVHLIYAF